MDQNCVICDMPIEHGQWDYEREDISYLGAHIRCAKRAVDDWQLEAQKKSAYVEWSCTEILSLQKQIEDLEFKLKMAKWDLAREWCNDINHVD
jgi:hypothetical protein